MRSEFQYKMEKELEKDLEELQKKLDEDNLISESDLTYLSENNSSILQSLLSKMFSYINFLSNIPVSITSKQQTLHNYHHFLHTKVVPAHRTQNNGQVPNWLQNAETIFKYGKDNLKTNDDETWKRIMERVLLISDNKKLNL